jgi:tetratricopeptide (TPR) repeat protein
VESDRARAIDFLTAAAADPTQRATALQLLGENYQAAGDSAAAVRSYRDAVQSRPDNATALNNLAVLLSAEQATRREAVELARRAVEAAEAQPALQGLRKDFLETLGSALLRSGGFRRCGGHIPARPEAQSAGGRAQPRRVGGGAGPGAARRGRAGAQPDRLAAARSRARWSRRWPSGSSRCATRSPAALRAKADTTLAQRAAHDLGKTLAL